MNPKPISLNYIIVISNSSHIDNPQFHDKWYIIFTINTNNSKS